MVDQGRRLYVAPVGGWYDCGKIETVLETNRHLLQQGRAKRPRPRAQVRTLDPVFVADGVEIEDSTLGPNVSIDPGAVIKTSVLRDAIVGAGATVVGSVLEECLVGDGAEVIGQRYRRMIVTRDEVAPAP
jgi:glucose-1-phosphate thymidylyltransferase